MPQFIERVGEALPYYLILRLVLRRTDIMEPRGAVPREELARNTIRNCVKKHKVAEQTRPHFIFVRVMNQMNEERIEYGGDDIRLGELVIPVPQVCQRARDIGILDLHAVIRMEDVSCEVPRIERNLVMLELFEIFGREFVRRAEELEDPLDPRRGFPESRNIMRERFICDFLIGARDHPLGWIERPGKIIERHVSLPFGISRPAGEGQ